MITIKILKQIFFNIVFLNFNKRDIELSDSYYNSIKNKDIPKNVDKKTKETFPPTKETLDKSKKQREKLSIEKLQTITNYEFLGISPENRLQYITKNNIKTEKISSGKVKKLEFTFTFDGKFNKELWIKTTAGQVLPSEVREVTSNGITYKRDGLKGEFFTKGNKRLIINEGTRLDNIKIGDISKLEEQGNKKIKQYLEAHPENQDFQDIVSEAIKRNIDPSFAILAFSKKIKDLPIVSKERQVLLEDMFTEFDRLRPGIAMWNGEILENGKYPDELVVKLLKKFGGKDWKVKAESYGISKENIKRYENLNTPKYLSLSSKNEILSRVPENIKIAIIEAFPPSEVENAILVAHGESGFKADEFRPAYKNPGGGNDLGLFQINDKYHPEVKNINWRDPKENAKLAYKIFRQAGNSWYQWYAARKIGLS